MYDIVKKYPELIKKISSSGHEIALHGLDYDLLFHVDDKVFERNILYAKSFIEDLLNEEVYGYRAPCFSMTESKLGIVSKHFRYDSSVIHFPEHKLYGSMILDDWNYLSTWLCKKGDFLEYKIPTIEVLSKNIPISGGGYLRLIPFSVYKQLLQKYLDANQTYLFYIHPFECCRVKLDLSGVSYKDKFRCEYGRSNLLSKIRRLIEILDNNNFEFSLMKDYVVNLSPVV